MSETFKLKQITFEVDFRFVISCQFVSDSQLLQQADLVNILQTIMSFCVGVEMWFQVFEFGNIFLFYYYVDVMIPFEMSRDSHSHGSKDNCVLEKCIRGSPR